MEIVINTSDSVPLFAQLFEQIKKAVLRAKLSPGFALPSIRQLANDLELNHNTVAKAYRLLERDSVIQTKGYRGTFIHLQEITRFEADELVFIHDIVDQNFYQDKKAMRFDFILSNDQFLIVIYNHDAKEKSYFVMAYKNVVQTGEQIYGNSHQHQRFSSAVCSID